MTGKEIQGNPKRTTPEGNTTRAFVSPAGGAVPLPEALVRFVAALAGGDSYLRCIPI